MCTCSALCNRWLSSDSMVNADDWEEQMIDRLVEMFKNMGMSLNKEQVKGLMKQFKSQFENMGLDAEKLSSGDVNFNFDLSNLSKMFQSGQSLDDILGNLGMDVKVDAAPVEIDTPDVEESNDEILKFSQQCGAKTIKRPKILSGDNATSESAILHALRKIKESIDYVVFMQATSPIRKKNDISQAIKTIIKFKIERRTTKIFI